VVGPGWSQAPLLKFPSLKQLRKKKLHFFSLRSSFSSPGHLNFITASHIIWTGSCVLELLLPWLLGVQKAGSWHCHYHLMHPITSILPVHPSELGCERGICQRQDPAQIWVATVTVSTSYQGISDYQPPSHCFLAFFFDQELWTSSIMSIKAYDKDTLLTLTWEVYYSPTKAISDHDLPNRNLQYRKGPQSRSFASNSSICSDGAVNQLVPLAWTCWHPLLALCREHQKVP